MQYIWMSRAQPYYNPNHSYFLYGLDADLIVLGSRIEYGAEVNKKGVMLGGIYLSLGTDVVCLYIFQSRFQPRGYLQ